MSGPIVSQNGISPNGFANDLMKKYDTNVDGILDVTTESFLRTKTNDIVKIESRGLLFTDADTFGDGDGSVSMAELVGYLNEFDTDKDGEITTYKNLFESLFNGESEWAKFDESYGERFKYDDI
jgi:Ca2+-binding EF-hand superfamily protein